jgi:hypothetical protein
VSVGSRVVRYHNGLLIVEVLMYFLVCGEADMLVLVDVIGFGQAGLFILCKGNAVVEEQVVAIMQSPERLLNVLLPGYLALPAVFLWIRGYDGFVVVHLQWWAAHIVVGGVVGLGKYGKCIMQCGFEFGH